MLVRPTPRSKTDRLIVLIFLLESGKDIVFIHDWAIEQARKAGSYTPGQRCFRFEFGTYAGSRPLAGLKFISRAG